MGLYFTKKGLIKLLSKSHIASGFTIGLGLLASNKIGVDLKEYIPGIILGSITPDIDTSKSWISQSVPFLDDRLRDTKFFKHRGITHGLSGMLSMILLYYFTQNDFTLGFGIGYIVHCLSDSILTFFKIKINYNNDKVLFNIFWVLNLILINYIVITNWR
jgi:membrane-bound metal-dependent hydrolase YbcI (DUF457 family)